MKRKLPAEPVIAKEILEGAKRAVHADSAPRIQRCTVCEAPCAPNSTEGLCWVCRRLKISAWHESDRQAVQE